ncbi:MAG TPA: hypothetical protein VEW03_11870, partial [Longimicrobiaceae bacterium]|nr:hypothetical protein [Longimicrobiaceae bacterium]
QNNGVADDHLEVAAAFGAWIRDNGGRTAEEWLQELFLERDNPLQPMLQGTTWPRAVRFALSRLVELPPGSRAHYYFGICTHRVHKMHAGFWNKVEQELKARTIVSLNYDLLVEQALHSGDGAHRTAPRCYYGGLPYTQVVRKMIDVTTQKAELVELGHDYVLYKLHGSLNWAMEPCGPTPGAYVLKIHDDVRAVFRADERLGVPAIVPPVPEKKMPAEFSQIWYEAGRSLSQCQRWFVCGYSMPDYDQALRCFFADVIGRARPIEVVISAPKKDWPLLVPRWTAIAPKGTVVRTLPGLPQALGEPWTV